MGNYFLDNFYAVIIRELKIEFSALKSLKKMWLRISLHLWVAI